MNFIRKTEQKTTLFSKEEKKNICLSHYAEFLQLNAPNIDCTTQLFRIPWYATAIVNYYFVHPIIFSFTTWKLCRISKIPQKKSHLHFTHPHTHIFAVLLCLGKKTKTVSFTSWIKRKERSSPRKHTHTHTQIAKTKNGDAHTHRK